MANMAGRVRLGGATNGTTRAGTEGPAKARPDAARLGVAGTAEPGMPRRGAARAGSVRPDRAGKGNGESVAVLLPVPIEVVKITEPNFREATLKIRGTSAYVQHAFSQKARIKMEETQRAGSRSRSRKTREARDFDDDFRQAQHISTEGWNGIPASGFRNAMISACKVVGFFQTRAKLAVFVLADGIDAIDGTPLVKIVGKPETHQGYARNENGVADLRWRPMWKEWSAAVRIEWDADMLSETDIANLMMRAGRQIGIGEGRPDSPNSNGLGWGRWELADDN